MNDSHVVGPTRSTGINSEASDVFSTSSGEKVGEIQTTGTLFGPRMSRFVKTDNASALAALLLVALLISALIALVAYGRSIVQYLGYSDKNSAEAQNRKNFALFFSLAIANVVLPWWVFGDYTTSHSSNGVTGFLGPYIDYFDQHLGPVGTLFWSIPVFVQPLAASAALITFGIRDLFVSPVALSALHVKRLAVFTLASFSLYAVFWGVGLGINQYTQYSDAKEQELQVEKQRIDEEQRNGRELLQRQRDEEQRRARQAQEWELAANKAREESEKQLRQTQAAIDAQRNETNNAATVTPESLPRNDISTAKMSSVVAKFDLVSIRQNLTLMLDSKPDDDVSISNAMSALANIQLPVKGDRKSARELNQLALEKIQKEDYSSSIDLLLSASEADPRDAEVLSNLAYALLKRDPPLLAEARNIALCSLALSPTRGSVWATLGEILAAEQKDAVATKAFLLALKFSKNTQKTLDYLRALADRSSGDSTLKTSSLRAISEFKIKN